jgi:hypothetical protein
MHINGIGEVPIADEASWHTFSWLNPDYLESSPPTFNPSPSDLSDYEYRLLKEDTKMLQLQRRKKNV